MGNSNSCLACGCEGKGSGDPYSYQPRIPEFSPEIGITEKPIQPPDPKTLRVEKVDLNISANGKSHHTDRYELMQNSLRPKLVTRRGQTFTIEFIFNRPYDKDKDNLLLIYSNSEVTSSTATISSADSSNAWEVSISSSVNNRVQFQVKPSSKCSVGKWKLVLQTSRKGNTSPLSYAVPEPIYVLFNPWCPDDGVFMTDSAALKEYVLEDSGLIWQGTYNRHRPIPWIYSQFESPVLDCALYLFNKHVSSRDSGDPINVSRAMSAAVNSNDDNGLLSGNWSNDYSEGTSPGDWTGSLAIIQQYYKTKRAVKFGQCWVFAGLQTTISRTLGIPCRPVTNFSSAHDTDGSLTLDSVVDTDGKSLDHKDSVWNFHVWNEAWFSRPDLENSEYSGWQAIDATPQEKSSGAFQCGPASVAAIKRGELKLPYDVPFVYSEVNADLVTWIYNEKLQTYKFIGSDMTGIGRNISTKAVGKYEREDITDSYKFPEGSNMERETTLKALKNTKSKLARLYEVECNPEMKDLKFELQILDDIVIGSTFRVLLKIENSNLVRSYKVDALLRVDTVMQNGKLMDEIKKETHAITVAPASKTEAALSVSYAEYGSKLLQFPNFRIVSLAKVRDTGYEYVAEDDFRVRSTDIEFEILNSDKILVGKPFKGTLTLKNPLPIKLTVCEFKAGGAGLGEPIHVVLKQDVESGQRATAQFEWTPRVLGKRTISAIFRSKELQDVDGFITIIVN